MSKLVWTAVVAVGLSATPLMAQSAGQHSWAAPASALPAARPRVRSSPACRSGEGAAIGAVGGAAIRATDGRGHHHHRHYRSHGGHRYWVDRHGNRHWD